MVTIRHRGQGFNVLFSNPGSGERGFSRQVKDIDAAIILIQHYYGKPHIRSECAFCDEERKGGLRS